GSPQKESGPQIFVGGGGGGMGKLGRRGLSGPGVGGVFGAQGEGATGGLPKKAQFLGGPVPGPPPPVTGWGTGLSPPAGNSARVRILASSGYSQVEAVRRFGSFIDGFVQKPYTVQVLVASIRDALQKSALQEERHPAPGN